MTIATTAAGAATLIVVLAGGAALRPRPRRVPGTNHPSAAHAPARRRVLAAIVALLAGAAVAAAGITSVVLVVGVIAVAVRARRRAAARQRARDVEVAMPGVVELLVLCVHAGCSPTQAIVESAARAPPAVRDVFAGIELALHRGQGLGSAIGGLAATGPLGREVAVAIAAADRDGGALAPVLDRLAADARAARRRRAEADARRLPVRLTFPLVACSLPAFVLLAIAPALLGALSTLRATA